MAPPAAAAAAAAPPRKPRAAPLMPRRLAWAVAALAGLMACPWERLDTSFAWDSSVVAYPGSQEHPAFTRSVLHIPSHGEQLEAWLYLPKHSARPPPVLLMAHGMGAQKDIGLWLYAERFSEAGIAVVLFDYRSFGGSTGQPRHWVSPRRHLQDWAVVVRHVQSTNLGGAVDGSRLGLWGVSYAGGHVLVTAARFGANISAVVANEPYVSPEAVLSTTAIRGVGRSLRLLAVGIADELRRLLGHVGLRLPPIYMRLVAPMSDPNALALLPLQDSEMAVRTVAAPPRRQGGWQNKVLARVVLEALGYNPSRHLGRVTAPLFFRIALRDHLCPPSVLAGALSRARLPPSQVTIQERDATHLEAHATGVKEAEVQPVLTFLRRHLGLEAAADAGAALAPSSQAQPGREAEVQFPEA